MFEQQIEETIASIKRSTIGENSSILLKSILEADIPASIKNYFNLDVKQWMKEEQDRLLTSPHFDYNDEQILHLFDEVRHQSKPYIRFSVEELTNTLDQAVKLQFNYLCRPQWTLSKFVFGEKETVTKDSIIEALDYFVDYEYYKLIIKEYLRSKNYDSMHKDRFEELISIIDNEVVKGYDSRKMAQLTQPIFQLFSRGGELETVLIPIEAVSVFYDDKNVSPIVERLDKEKERIPMLSLHDLTVLISEVDFSTSVDISNLVSKHLFPGRKQQTVESPSETALSVEAAKSAVEAEIKLSAQSETVLPPTIVVPEPVVIEEQPLAPAFEPEAPVVEEPPAAAEETPFSFGATFDAGESSEPVPAAIETPDSEPFSFNSAFSAPVEEPATQRSVSLPDDRDFIPVEEKSIPRESSTESGSFDDNFSFSLTETEPQPPQEDAVFSNLFPSEAVSETEEDKAILDFPDFTISDAADPFASFKLTEEELPSGGEHETPVFDDVPSIPEEKPFSFDDAGLDDELRLESMQFQEKEEEPFSFSSDYGLKEEPTAAFEGNGINFNSAYGFNSTVEEPATDDTFIKENTIQFGARDTAPAMQDTSEIDETLDFDDATSPDRLGEDEGFDLDFTLDEPPADEPQAIADEPAFSGFNTSAPPAFQSSDSGFASITDDFELETPSFITDTPGFTAEPPNFAEQPIQFGEEPGGSETELPGFAAEPLDFTIEPAGIDSETSSYDAGMQSFDSEMPSFDGLPGENETAAVDDTFDFFSLEEPSPAPPADPFDSFLPDKPLDELTIETPPAIPEEPAMGFGLAEVPPEEDPFGSFTPDFGTDEYTPQESDITFDHIDPIKDQQKNEYYAEDETLFKEFDFQPPDEPMTLPDLDLSLDEPPTAAEPMAPIEPSAPFDFGSEIASIGSSPEDLSEFMRDFRKTEVSSAEPGEDPLQLFGDLKTMIPLKDKKLYIKSLFNKDEQGFEHALDTLNKKRTWREASEYIDDLFIQYDIDMYSKLAIKFTDEVYKRYMSKT